MAKLREDKDCIENFTKGVIAAGLVEEAELATIDAEVSSLIEEAVMEAKASPKPGPEALLTDVYVSY